MKVCVSIPAYNEEKTIGRVVAEVKQVLKKAGLSFRILVVDDGSQDRTAGEARKAGAEVHSHPYRYGLAETFRTEMERALKTRADVIVHIDGDGQYLAGDIPKLIEPIKRGEADLVLGSRFMGDIESMPLIKRWGNRMFSRTISGISRIKITDAQTGFRAFRREVAEKVNITSRHTYTQEMILRAVREKFRIKEVPIFFAKRREGKSKLVSNPFSYAVRAWINIFRVYRDYEALKFFGSIGGTLLCIGVVLGIYLLYLLFASGFGIIDKAIPTILLTVLLAVSGIQILLFGFLADRND